MGGLHLLQRRAASAPNAGIAVSNSSTPSPPSAAAADSSSHANFQSGASVSSQVQIISLPSAGLASSGLR